MLETLIKEDIVIKKAHNKYKKFTDDDKMRELYDSRIKYERDKKSLIEEAELKGIEKGIEKEKIETARKMKILGLSSDIISKSTGLNVKEIQNL